MPSRDDRPPEQRPPRWASRLQWIALAIAACTLETFPMPKDVTLPKEHDVEQFQATIEGILNGLLAGKAAGEPETEVSTAMVQDGAVSLMRTRLYTMHVSL
jgi:hypothetical protein